MCGVVGILRTTGQADLRDQHVVERMAKSVEHRGPDGNGVVNVGPMTIGHQRLSIIDLEGGGQPMSDPGKRIFVSFNGEIYNHRALRSELEERGHQFRTQSDTEILIHLYLDCGLSMLEKLEGMYAFALFDSQEDRLLLARDPMGQKPLFWSRNEERIIFASEMRAIVQDPATSRTMNKDAIALYFRHDCVPAPWTIYEDVYKLEAGSFVVFDGPNYSPQHHEYCPFPSDETGGGSWGLERAKTELWDRIVQSVEQRLMSDVPLGLFLSGGVDSTIVLAAMAECMPAERIKCYSIGFEDASFDERGPAKLVADHFGAKHRVRVLGPQTSLEMIPEVLGHLSEPFADPSIVPTWLLSNFAREEVTVALGGDGGDEVFLGYPTFKIDEIARLLSQAPVWFRSGLPDLLSKALPMSDANMSPRFTLQRFAGGMRLDWPQQHFGWITGVHPSYLSEILAGNNQSDQSSMLAIERLVERERNVSATKNHLLSSLYSRLYLGECVLQKVDRASMANSLEVRAPLLSKSVVRAAMGLPHHLRASKAILRKILEEKGLPATIYKQKKKGFGIPVSSWLRGPLREYAQDLLIGQSIRQDSVLNADGVAKIWAAHQSKKGDFRKELWSILAFRIWEQGHYGPQGSSH